LSENTIPSSADKSGFEFTVVESPEHKVLALSGEIDVYTAPQFKLAMTSILESVQKHLILDLHNVSYMDSSAFMVLVYAMKRLRLIGGTVNLVGCKPRIAHTLQITNLSSIIPLYDNMDDALKALSA